METRHPLVQEMIDMCSNTSTPYNDIAKMVKIEDERDAIQQSIDHNYDIMAKNVKQLCDFYPANYIIKMLKSMGLNDEDVVEIVKRLK